ncbi:MAG: lysylphosphatidylglycerol synthase domain-containing protein [Gaiellaceae bacterium]
MPPVVERSLRALRSRWGRRAVNSLSLAAVVAVGYVVVHHFLRQGWPFPHPNLALVLLAAGLFLVAYGFKAFGWRRLFARGDRPSALTLAAAGGAAAFTGIVLPGRFDEAVRIGVVRRFRGGRTGIGALCLSLFLLGLLESAALSPLAGIAAVVSGSSGWFLAGLIVVAVAGVAAAAVVLLLPRIARLRRLAHFRLSGWVHEHGTSPGEASSAWTLVAVSWLLRGAALVVLLQALSLASATGAVPLALAFLCASAASAALPIAPAGAATQAGAGAAILIAAGIHTPQAIAFALAAQAVIILAGTAVFATAELLHTARRLRPLSG